MLPPSQGRAGWNPPLILESSGVVHGDHLDASPVGNLVYIHAAIHTKGTVAMVGHFTGRLHLRSLQNHCETSNYPAQHTMPCNHKLTPFVWSDQGAGNVQGEGEIGGGNKTINTSKNQCSRGIEKIKTEPKYRSRRTGSMIAPCQSGGRLNL